MIFDTKFYKNRWRPLNFRRILFFYFYFIVTSNYKNSMYPRSFLCEEAKIEQRAFSLKERTLWNRWGGNMGIPIHILFYLVFFNFINSTGKYVDQFLAFSERNHFTHVFHFRSHKLKRRQYMNFGRKFFIDLKKCIIL